MREFMMIFRNEKKAGGEAPSAEQMQAMIKQWQEWIRSIAEGGKYISTNRLLPEGKTVNSDNEIKDGPYVEAKEIVGGYVIVKTNTLDEAVEIARSCPNLSYGGKVEVRAVMSIEVNVKAEDFLNEKELTY